MKKINAYLLAPPFIIEMPHDAKILGVGSSARQGQDGEPVQIAVLFAEVDPEAITIRRTFSVVGAGHDVPECAETYIGRIDLEGGRVMLFVYEDKPQQEPSRILV